MKILHVTPILGPANGGSAIIPYELAKRQVLRGHDVTILTSNYKFDDHLTRSSNGVSIICFECGRHFQASFYTPDMREWLKTRIGGFDIVHLHNLRSYQSILVRHYATKHKVPYIVQAHGSAPIMEGNEKIKRIFDFIWTKRLMGCSSGFIAVSNKEIEQYRRIGADKMMISVIPNALDATNFANLPNKGEFRERNGISSQSKVILYLGRLNRRKGIDVLIKAFILLLGDRKDVILVICGPDDGFETHLRDLVEEAGLNEFVRFIGFVDDPIASYRDADIVAYPSRNEIFGLVPFEAIMSGTPIIVSDDSGCGEIVKEAKCGLTVPPDDERSICNSIRFLLDNPLEGREMVSRGRKYTEEKLSWETVISQFDMVYINAMKNEE